ncbi:uncharacterized protein LOC108917395 [Anoplophora glabripennis]|uniref:uncharacterized protein LOC108917395 n=1 Tax=Anoplophora glabripennis TaxID=217634 RepID=UPI000873D070|nr:uncharacterized protein LOC108917395 [Anoplophora glabripennis]
MASKGIMFSTVGKLRNFSSIKRSFTAGKIIYNKPPSSTPSAPLLDVPGLSEACVKVTSQPVGPGAAKNTAYKNPEYFCYDKNSYFEAEIEMLKYRCPQPSKHKPFFQNIPK